MGMIFSMIRKCCYYSLCCCCCYCCSSNQYIELTSDDTSEKWKQSIKSNAKFYHVLDGNKASVKFVNKKSYDDRYIWINIDNDTIHVSNHINKNEEHKEASLLNLTKVIKALPRRFYADKSILNSDCCITIDFENGGAIDILYENRVQSDAWHDVLKLYSKDTFKSPPSSSIELQKLS